MIAFDKGINAIVGPNGCGKSNIVDAFLWALGQQSAKTLRASSMQDVIFAGSLKRKAQNLAEVTVVLSNENGLLPVEYQEIAITRRVYRDGESEYLLNKQNVRLKDIVELLAHTGVGKESFAVIGQGKVAEIINQNPHDRRTLFEEVAGISHFLIKRKESERKLELAKTNRMRAQDIVIEVEGQKKILEKQAQDAKRFQEQRRKLACLERLLCQSRHDELDAAYKAITEALRRSEEQLKATVSQESSLKEAFLQKKEALKQLKIQHQEGQQKLHEVQSAIAALKKDVGFCEEKKASLLSQDSESNKEIKNFQGALQALLTQKQELEAQVQKSLAELKTLEAKKDEAHAEWLKNHQEKEELENSLKALYQKRFSLQSRLQALEADVKKSQLAQEVALEKIQERQKQKERFDEQKNQTQNELNQKKEELQALVAQVEEKKKRLEALTTESKANARAIEEKRSVRNSMQQELYEKSARHKALSQLANSMEGFSSGAKTILQEAKKPGSSLNGKVQALADVVTLQHELLMRLYDTSLVVSTIADLELLLEVADKLKAQEISCVCLERIGVADAEGLKSFFAKSVTDSDDFLSDALWVKNRYFVDSLGVIHLKGAKKENLFTRSETIKTLAKEMEEQNQTLLNSESALKELEQKQQFMQQEYQKLDQEMRRIDMQVVSCNVQVQTLDKKLRELSADFERHVGEMASLSELVETLRGQFEAKDKERLAAKETLQAVEKEFQESDAKAVSLRNNNTGLSDRRHKMIHAFEECRKRHEKEQHALELLQVRMKEQTIRHEQELKLQKTLQTELTTIDAKKEMLEKKLTEQVELLKQEQQAVLEKDQAAKVCEEEVKGIEELIDKGQVQKEESIKETSTQKAKIAHLKEQLEIYTAALQLPPPEGYDTFQAPVPTEEDLTRLKNSVERMRNVNLLAVEEYETAAARHKLLVEQLQDLQQAESELLQIVTDLEKESEKAFSKTFEEVKIAFKKHFQTLFQGGEADLVLAEGVEIMAKPPGKQMRSMQLLSGGEKTLTALALLFACFDVRPSPFCILDEVDAPLDESNVVRLGNLLRHFCDRTQFLVITHNKKTMQIAESLIGVSMAEKGVSQIISLDFRRRENTQGVLMEVSSV